MRRSALFAGILIVFVGAILLAINLGFVTHKVWSFFWPLVLVFLGAWFIYGTYTKKGVVESVDRSILLENEAEAEIEFNYGAGVLNVSSSANPQELVGGNFTGGLSDRVERSSGRTFVELKPPSDVYFPSNWMGGKQGLGWNVGVTRSIPLKLKFHTGACEANLNLSELKVTDLVVETGASSTNITLPQNAGFTRVEISSGAAEVNITVPQGVAAHIEESSGLSGIDVDTTRFIQNGHTYRSADYDNAVNKVKIEYNGGVGSVNIK